MKKSVLVTPLQPPFDQSVYILDLQYLYPEETEMPPKLALSLSDGKKLQKLLRGDLTDRPVTFAPAGNKILVTLMVQ